MDATADIAVVGGGPAGALAAVLLARAQPTLRIVLLERAPAPRAKPCGEFLAPHGCAVLARHGLLPAAGDAGGLGLDALRLVAGGAELHSPLPGTARGIRREVLDGALLAAADGVCAVRQGVQVVGCARSGSGWRLSLRDSSGTVSTLDAAVLFGADGRHSLVRHATGLSADPAGDACTDRHALSVRATGIAHGSSGGSSEGMAGEMHIGALGQVGVCPLGPVPGAPAGEAQVNLNLLLSPRHAHLLRRHQPAELIHLALSTTPSLAARATAVRLATPVLAAANLRQVARSPAGWRVALLGDAALCNDPFTGEGMSSALVDAELAATALAGWRPGDDPQPALAAYARAHRRAHRRQRLELLALPSLLDHRDLAAGAVALVANLGLTRLVAGRYAA